MALRVVVRADRRVMVGLLIALFSCYCADSTAIGAVLAVGGLSQ
jgi:hypothetical protein